MSEEIKVSEMPNLVDLKDEDVMMIIQDGINKKCSMSLIPKYLEEKQIIVSSTVPTTNERVWLKKGKNLLNLKYCNMYNFYNSNISNIQKNSITVSSLREWGYTQIDDFEVESGQTYTFSANYENSENSPTSIIIYNENDDTLAWQDASAQTGKFEVTFTANTNKVKIRFSVNNTSEIRKNTVKYTNIQLEVGNVATSFEEYIAKEIFYKDNDTWIKFMEEQPSRNVILTSVIPSEYISTVDVNCVKINNNVVEVTFRGYVATTIPGNTAVITGLIVPEPGITIMSGIGQQYGIEAPIWQYIQSEPSVRGESIPAGKWIHISFTYIINNY